MTSTQLINRLPLNVIASKKLLSSFGYMITPLINLGTKFKIISIENVGATTTGSVGNPNYKKIITNIPYNGIYLRLTLRLSDNSISVEGGDFIPFSDAIKIIDKQAILTNKIYDSIDGQTLDLLNADGLDDSITNNYEPDYSEEQSNYIGYKWWNPRGWGRN